MIRFPPPYEGPILSGRIDGFAYLLGWAATFFHLTLWVFVLLLGLDNPWPIVSTMSSVIATLLFITIVIVIHRRLGEHRRLPLNVVWQWWLGLGIRSAGLYGCPCDCRKRCAPWSAAPPIRDSGAPSPAESTGLADERAGAARRT